MEKIIVSYVVKNGCISILNVAIKERTVWVNCDNRKYDKPFKNRVDALDFIIKLAREHGINLTLKKDKVIDTIIFINQLFMGIEKWYYH